MDIIIINNRQVSTVVLEQRLDDISNISYGTHLLREDLSVARLSGITWFFWAFLGAFMPCLRASIYQSNLTRIRANLITLEGHQAIVSSARLLAAYKRARQRFEIIYPIRAIAVTPSFRFSAPMMLSPCRTMPLPHARGRFAPHTVIPVAARPTQRAMIVPAPASPQSILHMRLVAGSALRAPMSVLTPH